jgi:MOSC domain-containing protein YiiM
MIKALQKDGIVYLGTLKYICISEHTGTSKQSVSNATLIENFGLRSDAHAGSQLRQVSLLDEADIETMRSKGLELNPGAFGENFVISGLNLSTMGIGTILRIGKAELEVTQIGKVCHDRCAIYYQTGDCIMPRAGVFARVLIGGDVEPGMNVSPKEIITE